MNLGDIGGLSGLFNGFVDIDLTGLDKPKAVPTPPPSNTSMFSGTYVDSLLSGKGRATDIDEVDFYYGDEYNNYFVSDLGYDPLFIDGAEGVGSGVVLDTTGEQTPMVSVYDYFEKVGGPAYLSNLHKAGPGTGEQYQNAASAINSCRTTV